MITFVVENYLYMILYPNAKINIGLNILSKRKIIIIISLSFFPIHYCYDILEIKRTNKFYLLHQD